MLKSSSDLTTGAEKMVCNQRRTEAGASHFFGLSPSDSKWCSWTWQRGVRPHSSQVIRTHNVQVSRFVFPQSVQKCCSITPRPPALSRSIQRGDEDRQEPLDDGWKGGGGGSGTRACESTRRWHGAGGHQAGGGGDCG